MGVNFLPPQRFAGFALLALIIFAVYWPVCGFGFSNWDDDETLWHNPDFNPVSWSGVGHYWRHPHMDLYVPVTYTFWGALAAISPNQHANGRVNHTANVVLLCIAAGAVSFLLRDLVHDSRAAFLGALLFALHPVQVEPVGWVSGGKDLLSTCLALLALAFYVRWARRGRSWRDWRYWLGLFAFLLAMLSKPAALTTPALAAVLDIAILRAGARQTIRSLAPWIVLAVPVILIGRAVQPPGQGAVLPAPQRIIVAADALTFYLQKIIWPAHLCLDYGRMPERVVLRSTFWLNASILFFLGLLLGWRRGKAPWMWAGAALFALALAPVLGLIPFDFQRFSTVADHYLCLAMLGPALLLASVVTRFGKPAAWASALLCLALGGRAFAQTWAWRDTETLFHSVLKVNPRSLAANGVLAVRAPTLEQATPYFDAALAAKPGDARTSYNYANAFLRAQRPADAIRWYEQALRQPPGKPVMHNNYAIALLQVGRTAEAIEQLRQAVKLDPGYADAEMNLGKALVMQGDPAAAAEHLRRALHINPQLEVARRLLDQIGRP